jgi:predicted porin
MAAGGEPLLEGYGSIRVQLEHVRADNQDAQKPYTALRDAYTRLGAKGDHDLLSDLTLTAQVEMGLDSANFEAQDPYFQGDDRHIVEGVRVGHIGLEGSWGRLRYGQQWVPYYNAIAAPVDQFSSYYSGFATFSAFTRRSSVFYSSPEIGGVSTAFGTSLNGGLQDEKGEYDNRHQIALSYQNSRLTLAAGYDHLGGVDSEAIAGLSAAVTHPAGEGILYVAAKYERYMSDRDSSGWGEDGSQSVNLFGRYTTGQHSFKAMIAQNDHYGEGVAHLGYDRQVDALLKLFMELYAEEETAAITAERLGREGADSAASGGVAFLTGFRYDF